MINKKKGYGVMMLVTIVLTGATVAVFAAGTIITPGLSHATRVAVGIGLCVAAGVNCSIRRRFFTQTV